MAGRLCRRYGPGRLPYASRRDVGGGLTMAATGLLAAALWFGGAGALVAAGVAGDTLGFFLGVGVLVAPLALPASFVVGALVWRTEFSAASRPRDGAIFGGLTALGSLAVGAFGPAVLVAASNVLGGEMSLVEGVVFGSLLVPVGFLFATVAVGWLVVPLGVFGGWYHERATASS